MRDNIPSFIIVGSMKSGSTSLMYHLRNHKNIHTPPKEVHFFNRDENFNKGVEWYKNILTNGLNDNTKVVGEKTPTYSYQSNVPRRIFESFPDTKIIWIFRNPVDRTYSNYLHSLTRGNENLSFEKAIEKEGTRIKKNIFKGYRIRSIYHKQVSSYLKFFPKENMFFMLLEDLIQPYDEDHILNDLFEFLDVTKENFDFNSKPKNVTVIPKYPIVLYYGTKSIFYKFSLFRKFVRKISFYGSKPGYTPMDSQIRTELVDYFKKHNEKLSKLIDKDLTIWDK